MTCKTHHECVKLIKKTGDTLALKVYTSPNAKTLLQTGGNFTSTSIVNGTINPSATMSNVLYQSAAASQQAKSYSYYASSTISAQPQQLSTPQSCDIQSRHELNALFLDGTKSLPSKKKRKFLLNKFSFSPRHHIDNLKTEFFSYLYRTLGSLSF